MRDSRQSFSPKNDHGWAMTAFSDNVREVMATKGITQQQLADKLGASRPGISRMLSGIDGVTLDRAERIANALGCDLVDLLSRKKMQKTA